MGSNIRVRSMVKEDVPQVLTVEKASGDLDFKNEAFFYQYIGSTKRQGIVGLLGTKIVGFVTFKLFGQHDILQVRLVVHPKVRRQGIGRALVDAMVTRFPRRDTCTAAVRESNLSGQLFLKATGFECKRIRKDFFTEPPENAYVFNRKEPVTHVD